MKVNKHQFKRTLRIQREFQRKTRRMMAFLAIVVMCAFAVPAMSAAFENPESAPESVLMIAGGVSMASMAVIGNVEDTSDRDAAGGQIAYRVWLISTDQIDMDVNFPDPNANREVGTIPMLPGEVFHYFEAHDIPTDNSTGTKGDITTETTNTFVMIMAGIRDKLLDFIEQHVGKKFIVIYQECETGALYIMGNPCKPMVLSAFDRKNDKEGRYITFTFTNNSFRQPYRYVGAIVKSAPVTLAPDATALAVVANNDLYIVPDGTDDSAAIATVTGLTDADRGRTITVKGSGATHPGTIEENAVFILEGGATWTATVGSSIVFRVLDANRLVEVGSRVQA